MPETYKPIKLSRGKKVAFLMGNEACSVAALHAGCRFYAGYPITPSSEVAAVMALKLPQYGGAFMQMEDEISSIAAVIGAAMTGVKAMTATSGPGFSLKQENIGYACLCEVPCVIVNVQRGGPSTGLPTQASQSDVMQAKWGTHGDHPIVALAPSTVAEIYEYTIQAFNISEMYRTPVILLLDEVLSHLRERLEIPPLDDTEKRLVNRKTPTVKPKDFKPYDTAFGDVPPMAAFGSGYRFHTTGLIHDEAGFPTERSDEIVPLLERINRKIKSDDPKLTFWREFYTDDMTSLVISYGASARVTKRAVELARKQGKKIGMLHLITLWPSPERLLARLVRKVKKVFVVEMNMGQYILEVQRFAGDSVKVKPVNRIDGRLFEPADVLKEIVK
ncbi:MAG: 2-oxoacid:acceptor oxidoreductase subunit alpha [Candidatus Brocadiia bacterium]